MTATAEAVKTDLASAPPAPEPKPFQSPLDNWIEHACRRCKNWQKSCNLGTEKAISVMMLCVAISERGF